MSGCDVCGALGDGRQLFANVDGKGYCSRCWRKAGRPWPKRAMTSVEIANAEIQVREKMLKKGGNSRYMARSGKA